jgi:hypothetical protein
VTTVAFVVPVAPPYVALIVATPACRPVTNPPALTPATDWSED